MQVLYKNYSRATSFPIKQSHPEHKSGPDLKIALDTATKNSSKKGVHIKHSLQAYKTEGNTVSIRKTLYDSLFFMELSQALSLLCKRQFRNALPKHKLP